MLGSSAPAVSLSPATGRPTRINCGWCAQNRSLPVVSSLWALVYLMLSRRMLVLIFSAVLIARTFHCVATGVSLAALAVQPSNSESPPLRNPDDADPNESGCICRGALVPPLVTAEAAGLTLLPACPSAAQTASDRLVVPVEPDIGRSYEQYLLGPPPLGGKSLRAWTHLLLI